MSPPPSAFEGNPVYSVYWKCKDGTVEPFFFNAQRADGTNACGSPSYDAREKVFWVFHYAVEE